MFGPLYQTTGQWSIDWSDLRNPYPDKWTLIVIWPIHALSLLSRHLYKPLVGLILYKYKFKFCFAWFVLAWQFPRQEVSESIANTDMKQIKWKKSDLSNARDRANSAVTTNTTDHDPDHPNVWNKWFFSF